MRFIHFSDVHLDMAFTSLRNNKELIKKRRLEQKQIFNDAINLVRDENIEFLFISGDLFEQKYVEEDTINYIISCFNKIPNTHIFISPGNHDPLIKNSPYNVYDWPENVVVFGMELGKYTFDNINIYGVGFEDYEMDSNVLEDIILDENYINILITHGTLDGAMHKYHDIKSKNISKFDYVALGHIHIPKVDDSKIIYPGSLVAGGFDELGEHGLVIGNLIKDNLDISFKNMDYRQFKILEIDVTNCNNVNDVIEKIVLKEDIYRILFTGVRDIDTKEVIDYLKSIDKYIIDIIDNTYIKYNLEDISKQNTLKGIFTKNMLDMLEENPLRKKEIMMAIEVVYKNI